MRTSATGLANGTRDLILVWIDGREAAIVRNEAAGPSLEHVFARLPERSHRTGRLRHDATVRHGEEWKGAADRRREQHLEAFLAEVERRLDPGADLRIIGPGPVHERLAREVKARDARHGNARSVTVESAERLTPRQLQARLREAWATLTPEVATSSSSAIR
ncbi:MAG TPA: hypothetical protein VLA66_14350 [Thermoanaerobaculia bacterium]|nr:hypothetical protein [Thermoanaerobaculia bacterium]